MTAQLALAWTGPRAAGGQVLRHRSGSRLSRVSQTRLPLGLASALEKGPPRKEGVGGPGRARTRGACPPSWALRLCPRGQNRVWTVRHRGHLSTRSLSRVSLPPPTAQDPEYLPLGRLSPGVAWDAPWRGPRRTPVQGRDRVPQGPRPGAPIPASFEPRPGSLATWKDADS